MSEIRSWAVGALAVVVNAVGAGAGVQIARTSDVPVAPVAPVVAAVPALPAVTAPPTSAPPAAVSPATTATPTTTASATPRATTTRPTTTRTTRVPRSTTVRERPVIHGRSAAQAYRGCVAASNSPGPLACRALVDACVRGG